MDQELVAQLINGHVWPVVFAVKVKLCSTSNTNEYHAVSSGTTL